VFADAYRLGAEGIVSKSATGSLGPAHKEKGPAEAEPEFPATSPKKLMSSKTSREQRGCGPTSLDGGKAGTDVWSD
jgi:hypothetical protein